MISSTKLNIWSSSWWIMNFNWGGHCRGDLIFSSVVWFFISKADAGFVAVFRIITWKFAVNLLLLFSSLFFSLFLIIDLIDSIIHLKLALIVIFSDCINDILPVGFFSTGLGSSLLHPKDQFVFPPGLLWTLTLVVPVYPMFLWFMWS